MQLIFEHGARLADPDGLLEGETLKQVRYVTLRPGQRIRTAALQRLLIAALHHGSLRTRSRRPSSE
ncbi:MAG: hypothetical protein ACRENP_09870 [Longimicrobiales bacterium]